MLPAAYIRIDCIWVSLILLLTVSTICFQWKLVCNQEILADTITSIQMAGVLVGAVLTGQLADLFGRRHILFIEHFFLVIMWFCSAFSSSWGVYAGLRFVIGALTGGWYSLPIAVQLHLLSTDSIKERPFGLWYFMFLLLVAYRILVKYNLILNCFDL